MPPNFHVQLPVLVSSGDMMSRIEGRMVFQATQVQTLVGRDVHASQSRVGEEVVAFKKFHVSVTALDDSHGIHFLQMVNSDTSQVHALDLTRTDVLSRVKDFSTIDLTATTNNTIKLNWAAVAILSSDFDAAALGIDSSKALVVSGHAGDAMQLVNLKNWSVSSLQTAEELSVMLGPEHSFLAGHLYTAYSLFGVTVFVDGAIAVTDATNSVDTKVASQAFSIEHLFGPQASAPETQVGLTSHNELGRSMGSDSGGFKGVAIVSAGTGGAHGDITQRGHYELSKDGGATWLPVAGDLNATQAVYADKSAWIRFVADGAALYSDPQSLVVRLIDDASLKSSTVWGVASTGSSIDLSAMGLGAGLTDALFAWPSSSKASLAWPAKDLTMVSDGVGSVAPSGVAGCPVSSLVGFGVGGHTNKGLAITGVDQSQGTLYYSTDGGYSWTEVNTPLSSSRVLFLRSDADNRLYFRSTQGAMVPTADALSICAWDQSQNTAPIFLTSAEDDRAHALATGSLALSDASDVGPSVESVQTTELAESNASGYDNIDPVMSSHGEPFGQMVMGAAVSLEGGIRMDGADEGSHIYSLNPGPVLDLNRVIGEKSLGDVTPGSMAQMQVAIDPAANVFSLTLADVLSLPSNNGMRQLMLTGDADDQLVLNQGEWQDTGNVVKQGGHSYAVYSGITDSTVQLLIDHQMLLQNH